MQGKMGWQDAMNKCKSIGMRLPKSGDFVEEKKKEKLNPLNKEVTGLRKMCPKNYAYSYNLENRNVVGSEKRFIGE